VSISRHAELEELYDWGVSPVARSRALASATVFVIDAKLLPDATVLILCF
jgi:hypothetical protein